MKRARKPAVEPAERCGAASTSSSCGADSRRAAARAVDAIAAGRVIGERHAGHHRGAPGRRGRADRGRRPRPSGEVFVSRGGTKLAGALDAFGIDVRGPRAPSTSARRPAGSPTACSSAAPRTWWRSTSGRGQLAWALRNDPRVTVMERTNVRELEAGAVDPPGRPVRRRPLVHLAAHRRAQPARAHHARRRLRAAGEAAVRGRPCPHRQGRHRARPGGARRGAARGRGRARAPRARRGALRHVAAARGRRQHRVLRARAPRPRSSTRPTSRVVADAHGVAA